MRGLRTSAGLRQSDAAERMRTSQGVLSRMEGRPLLDLTMRSAIAVIRATDPGATVTLTAGGATVEGAGFRAVVEAGPEGGPEAEGGV